MQVVRLSIQLLTLLAVLILSALLLAAVSNAQTLVVDHQAKPDVRRVLTARQERLAGQGRKNGYVPVRTSTPSQLRLAGAARSAGATSPIPQARALATVTSPAIAAAIVAGTPLSRILHTSQLSLSSTDGTLEQFADRNQDLVADDRTTFDASAGAFDVAVGRSGSRYKVFSDDSQNTLRGILVVAVDTNGDYQRDTFATYDLQRDFLLPSAAAVVTGTSASGREFVVICSSGYYNSSDPNDPNNEPSPGVVLLVRDPVTGGFDNSRSLELVRVGDNRLYNANGLALLPNNDLLIADFHSNELRIVRDTNGDRMPDTLDTTPYFSYRFSNDAPLDVAVNSRGVVFSHSVGNDMFMLALYDDNGDGQADRDEVCVEGLSIDDNLFLHGLTVSNRGTVFVIEDANGSEDGPGGNGGTPRIDAFRDPALDGFLIDGVIFTRADNPDDLAFTGLSFGVPQPNPIDRTDFFVRQQYLDFLNREPDPPGFAGWQDVLNNCTPGDTSCDRVHVSAAFFQSPEFQQRGYFTYRFYSVSFGRKPDYTEFTPDLARVSGFLNDAQLEAAKVAFVNDFMARPAFASRYNALNNSQYVDTLLQTAGVTLGNRDSLIAALNSGTRTRAQVLREIVESTQVFQRYFNQAFVVMQYFGYLHRDPDSLYLNWIQVLDQGGDFRAMVTGFVNSLEYRFRFEE